MEMTKWIKKNIIEWTVFYFTFYSMYKKLDVKLLHNKKSYKNIRIILGILEL